MGLSASNSFVKNTVNSLTSVVSTSVNNVTQNIQTQCTGINTFTGVFGSIPTEIDPDGTIKLTPCPTNARNVTINQISQNSCGLQGGLTATTTQNITNELATNINQWLTSQATANNGFIGFGISIASAEGINQVDLSNQIASAVTSNLVQNCSASVNASNSGNVYFCGDYPNGIAITQSAVNSNLTSCTVNSVVTNIGNNQVLNDIVQKAAAKASATNEGIFSGLKWLIIPVIIVAVLIFIGVILYFVFGSKSSSPPKEDAKKAEVESLERRVEEKRRLEQSGIPPTSPASHSSPYSTHELFSPHNAENLRSGLESALGRFRGE
jgi:hypothetical protein